MEQTRRPERMSMAMFWARVAHLPDQGWEVRVDGQRMFALDPPQKAGVGRINLNSFDVITAVAYQLVLAVSPAGWRDAAERLRLPRKDANRIKDASRDITPLVSHLKRTRIKILRALGLNLNDYLGNEKLR